MLDWSFRQIWVICLALSLVVGLGWQGAQAGQGSRQTGTAVMKMDVQASNGCMGCVDQGQKSPIKMNHSLCAAICGAQLTILQTSAVVVPVERTVHSIGSAPFEADRTNSPEPYPPKSVVLA